MTETVWINVKTAAGLVGIKEKQFRCEWTPEEGPAQVRFRNTNGKAGHGRRIEVDLADLEAVLADRTHQRAV